jgi:DNA-binding IclR family transcriptional regulator
MPVMRETSVHNGCDVLLASMYQDKIVAVHHERGPDSMTVSFSRGRLMPLFRGAGSKVILAALPSGLQEELYHQHLEDAALSSLGASWEEVKGNLRSIRRAGYAISVGELDPVNVGIAVPLMLEKAMAPSSIVLVLSAVRYRTTDVDAIVRAALSAQERILSGVTCMNARV